MQLNVFDNLLDAVFVVDSSRTIVYANGVAAALCESSEKRMIGRKKIYECIEFDNSDLLTHPDGQWGLEAPTPYVEVSYKLPSGGEGRVQVAITPFTARDEKLWMIMAHDVTLEEALARKYKSELQKKEYAIEQLRLAHREVEAYSKNLEKVIAERTFEIRKANTMLSAIMESLGQGFLVFDPSGRCDDIHTHACYEILEVNPAQRLVWNVLKLKPHEVPQFQSWLRATFDESLPFESMVELGPRQYEHSQGRMVTLNFFPLRDEATGKIASMVMVATDETDRHEAELALREAQAHANMILRFVKSRNQVRDFMGNLEARMDGIRQSLSGPDLQNRTIEIKRELHTIEGEAGVFALNWLRELMKKAQDELSIVDTAVIRTEVIHAILNEVIAALADFRRRHQVLLAALRIETDRDVIELPLHEAQQFRCQLEQQGVSPELITSYQELVSLKEVSELLAPYSDMLVGLAERLNKPSPNLEICGGELRLDPGRFGGLVQSFVHLFRNIMDHGIEMPEEREACGKAPSGLIRITVEKHEESGEPRLRWTVTDDGQGIDVEKLKARLRLKMGAGVEALSDQDILMSIFDSGVSTRETVSEFSGRGVGMEALRYEVEELGGRLALINRPGLGLSISIDVPLPTASHSPLKNAS